MNRFSSHANRKVRSGPWRITFDTNPDLCNINCVMCEVHSNLQDEENRSKEHGRKSRVMDPMIIRSVVESAVPVGLREIIPSTMGEPLLYPWFHEFIDLAHEYDVKLNLTTNGTFPGIGISKWAELLLPIVSDIKISINGATSGVNESIMQGIEHDTQLMNIREMVRFRDIHRTPGAERPSISFQVTYMRQNIHELPYLLKLAISLGIDRFKGHHIWVTWSDLESESLRRRTTDIESWNHMVDELYHIAENYSLPGGGRIVLENVHKLPINGNENAVPNDWTCPFGGKEAWIAWDGTLNVCCSPDELRRSLGHFGNVIEHQFVDLWMSSQYDSFVQNCGSYHVCKKCNMRKPAKPR